MALIVAVHGIGQQYKGDAVLHGVWWPALLSGMRLAGRDLDDPKSLLCAFYGHLFRRSASRDSLATGGPELQADDVTPEEAELLEVWLREAASLEPNLVKSPDAIRGGQSLARTPVVVQQMLSAISQSSFFANVFQSAFIGDLRQVTSYLKEPAIREEALSIVLAGITADTRVVVAHSLGSVIAYEALCKDSRNVVSFVTIGSPLGIRNVIFDKLTPRPDTSDNGAWPGKIRHWTNIADSGDIVALEKRLSRRFGERVRDLMIYSGADPHHGERYLTAIETGRAINEGIWGSDS